MTKGILATAVALSMLTLSGCSQENKDQQTADSSNGSISTQNTQAAIPAQEPATTHANNSVAAVATSVATQSVPSTTAAVAAAATAVAAAPEKILRDENGQIILTQAVIDGKIQASRETVKAFGSALKNELVTAMKEGGPVNALGVCNLKAPEIAQQVSSDRDMKVSRVSLKNRSLAGEPSEWQRAVLNDFEARKAAGESPQALEFSEVVEYGGKNMLRYMKAIPAGEVCMKCHGSNIAPEVQSKLSELYPNDKATGFSVGDLRGAFVVLQEM